MGINRSTVYNWIEKLDKKTESSACSQEQVPEKPQTVDIIEMDELFFLHQGEKNRTYVITLATRKPRQIVGFDVVCDKSENRIQKTLTIRPKLYYSDANPNYQKVSYSGQRFYFRDKSHTFTVKSTSLRFNVSPNAFFRSLKTFQAIMRVFVHAYNKFGEFKRQFPHLNFAVGLTSFLPCL